MNITELRIGNFVNDTDDTFHIVSATYRNGIEMEFNDLRYFIDEDVICPIPLTDEWLLKLGFVIIRDKESKLFLKDIDGNICILYNSDQTCWVALSEANTDTVPIGKIIKYVHQLQNLYFCLTGEELIIKLSSPMNI